MEVFVTYRRSLSTVPAEEGQPTDLALADFGRFVDFLAGSRELACCLTGNEPTLHPDFPELVGLARRKKIDPLVETSGIVLDEVAKFLVAERVNVSLRLYHPRFYDPEQRSRLLALAGELGRQEVPLCVVVLASESVDDYAWVGEFLRQVPCRQVVLRTLPTLDAGGRKQFASWASAVAPAFLAAGGAAVLDCGLQACAFDDADLGKLVRHGVRLQECMPRLGVDTALRVYHCREMVPFAGAPLAAFKTVPQVRDYFYRRHNELQWDYRFFPECPPCPSLRFANCQGPCMGIKARRLAADVDRLKAVVAADGAIEPLVDLGRALFELSHFGEAEQVLAEARRLEPGRGDVHLLLARALAALDRLNEADEEYHKAARLLPGGERVLMEWAHLLGDRGKTIRSKRVEEEVRLMVRERDREKQG